MRDLIDLATHLKSLKEAMLVQRAAYGKVIFKLIEKIRLLSVLFTKNSICLLQINSKNKLNIMNNSKYNSDVEDSKKKKIPVEKLSFHTCTIARAIFFKVLFSCFSKNEIFAVLFRSGPQIGTPSLRKKAEKCSGLLDLIV